MEKDIKSNEWELHHFLEQKNFDELSVAEKNRVVILITVEEYKIRRQIIISSREKDENLIPLPLVLPTKKSGIVIPLYQAMLAVAAAVLVMFFLQFPYSNIDGMNNTKEIKYVSVTDTIKEIEYVYDTIYKEIEKTKVVEKKVYVPKVEIQYVEVYTKSNLESREVLTPPSNIQKPNLKAFLDEVDGAESLADDPNAGMFSVTMYRD